MSYIIWIILGLIITGIFWLIAVYNSLIGKKNQVNEAWSDIDVQLKRRYNLIPNLMQTVKGYATHEEETFKMVVEARNKFTDSKGSVEGSAQAENMLSGSLKNLFALAESYPELKANENFKALQIELSGTEDKIAYARQFYNDTVQKYNQTVLVFPNNIIINLFGKKAFEQAKFFEVADATQRENVKVEF
jgi:LemA protein